MKIKLTELILALACSVMGVGAAIGVLMVIAFISIWCIFVGGELR